MPNGVANGALLVFGPIGEELKRRGGLRRGGSFDQALQLSAERAAGRRLIFPR